MILIIAYIAFAIINLLFFFKKNNKSRIINILIFITMVIGAFFIDWIKLKN